MKRAVEFLIVVIATAYRGAIHTANAQVEPAGDIASDSIRASATRRHGASQLEDRLTRILVDDGYANVAAVVERERVSIVYENARYRDPRRGLRRAAELLQPEIAPGQELILVPTVTAVPLLSAHYCPNLAGPATEPVAAPARVSMDVSDLPTALLRARRSSSSFGRLDVVIHPWFEASFGDFDNPIASRTGIAPELRMALRPGLTVSAQALFTLQDDLHTGESRVRPGVVTVNQTVRLPRNLFVAATAGLFARNRYGIGTEITAYSIDTRWSLGAELGITGESSFINHQWGFTALNQPTALMTITHRLQQHGVTMRTTAGVFLPRERGARLDVVRKFGEFELGWFGVTTGRAANGGLTLRIPLPQQRYSFPAPVRLRSAETFVWHYRYSAAAPSGQRYPPPAEYTWLSSYLWSDL